MPTETRLYVVAPKTVAEGEVPHRRLVRAPNAAQALRHVANDYVVTVASQDDVFDLASAGVKVENAGGAK